MSSSSTETTATDIITYIGVPLAVLGVLPILYTFALSILTQRRIRHSLLVHGHRPHTTRNNQEGFMLRASPMTSLIEVEMPRYTIAPVERADSRYWSVSDEAVGAMNGERVALLTEDAHGENQGVGRVESTLSMIEEGRVRGFLRGGSWRTFHWRRLVVGRKLYRIQYEDELREPPAEIDFADLVNFLMDWGAELDQMGWEKLRSGGLWTPSGTILLRIHEDLATAHDAKDSSSRRGHTNRGDWVLRTSMPDDSDGILTLCVRWPPGGSLASTRDASSLPPGWGRLRRQDVIAEQDDDVSFASDSPNSSSASINQKQHFTERSHVLTDIKKPRVLNTSCRFTLESGVICKAYAEAYGKENNTVFDLFRMSRYPLGQQWFTSGASSVLTLTKSNGSLWGYEPPNEIATFVRKESIPCGVLVILGILDPEAAPHWHEEIDSADEARVNATKVHARFQARMQAERLEATMPPEQAKVHRMNREMEERQQHLNQVRENLAAKRNREQRRLQDAIISPRMSNKAVSEACLAWLIANGEVPQDPSTTTMITVAESTLYSLIIQSQHREDDELDHPQHPHHDALDEKDFSSKSKDIPTSSTPGTSKETMPILHLLDEWLTWSVAGGMKREHVEMLEQRKREFCRAACIVAVVAEACSVMAASGSQGGGRGRAGVDMLECLRLWRKVRLG